MKKILHSKSEQSGISLLTDKDLVVFCPGVSIVGKAEIQMAQLNRGRKIFATSIDEEGVELAGRNIAENGVSKQIKLKQEDLSKSFPYKDNFFDFVYAHLILHYLTKQKLEATIGNLFKATKPGGHLYIVVRSEKDWEANLEGSTTNNITGQVTFTKLDSVGKPSKETTTRSFHTKKSISSPVKNVGYEIKYVREYEEQLYLGPNNTFPEYKQASLIELFAKK